LAYARIGASPDGGATWLLPRLTGYQRAMELMLLADKVDAAVLLQMGAVNRVVPAADLAAETAQLARRLSNGPARAYAETKALANRALMSELPAHLAAEALAFSRCAASADFAEGVRAFIEKRKPLFKGI
jgi:2-(1,2-epoxy-1,2-dihydrophenyl)acetyl-CoA isomerase